MFPGAGDARALSRNGRPLQKVVVSGRRFLLKRPLLAKAVPTSIGFAFGDFLTQVMNRPKNDKSWRYNYTSSATMFAIGAALAAPVGLSFLRWMDVHILPSSPNSPITLTVKFILDQVLGCAIWQCSYLTINEPYREAAIALGRAVQDNWNEQAVGFKRKLQFATA